MANLSKIKREKMLAFIDELKAQQTDENNILMLNNIRNELDRKRYGLVWEEHTEHVDEQLIDNIPVFKEDKSREIVSDENLPYNFLLEGDNLHSLKLLEKTHKGKIDVIYIDPPYNTGAKDWKYDNNYVDSNDTFRHSKWLSMMKARVDTAKKLLSKKGVLICAIDENEQAPLVLMLESIFGNNYDIDVITIVHNPRGVQGNNFSYTHEYAVFVHPKGIKSIGKRKIPESEIDWRNLRDNGGESLRTDARNCFYPIIVKDGQVIGFGDVVSDMTIHPCQCETVDDCIYIYPIDTSGVERKWRYARQTVDSIKNMLRVKKTRNHYEIELGKNYGTVRTVWQGAKYDANEYGKKIVNDLVVGNTFDFPKSLWNVFDCIYAVIGENKSATILDFFAGSGTTGHAVMELNKEDGGNRKFILCTNNENNICEDVTYQRLKTVITGKRKDGSDYSEGIPANLKYFKTDWTKRHPENYFLSHALLLHITEMIELQNAIKVDNKKYVVVLREKDFTDYVVNNADRANIKKLWIREDLILSNEQNKLLQTIKFAYIPREYFSVELQEVGE